MPLLLGGLLLVTVVLLLKWYMDADVKKLKSSLRWTGILLGLLVAGFLAVTGRLGPAIGFIIGLGVWAWRVFGFVQVLRQIGGVFGGFGFGRGAGAKAGQSSDVTSAFLAMTLDHDTGALDGAVVQGRFRGRRLGALGEPELLSLLAEIQGDPDSLGLLEAYLDRRWPTWRETAPQGGGNTASPPATGAMDAAEALRILGLSPGASKADIKTAYRRLMAQLHPDHGGSDYLAAKVNAAKDVLLKS